MKKCIAVAAVLVTFLAASASEVLIGSGTTDATRPWTTTYDSLQFQCLYLQSDINRAGSITQFGFQNGTVSAAQTYPNVTIRMWHTNLTSLGVAPQTPPAGSEVLQVSSLTVGSAGTAGWESYALSTPFSYNNVQNLMVEVRWAARTAPPTGPVTSKLASNASFVTEYHWLAGRQWQRQIVQPQQHAARIFGCAGFGH